EREELEHAQRDRRMKAKAPLVWANRAVHLHAISAVDLNLSAVILPRHPEHHHPFVLDEPLQDPRLPVLGVARHDEAEALEHFLDGLMKLRLGRVSRTDLSEDFCDVLRRGTARGHATDMHHASSRNALSD